MKKKGIEYIGTAIVLLFIRLIYVLITHKPYFEGVFVSTLIGIFVVIIVIDFLFHKRVKQNRSS